MTKTFESFLSFVLLGVLVLIGTGVFFKQYHYNPTDFAAHAGSSNASMTVNKSPNLELAAPTGYTASPKTETFDADSLYSKIDGKAELYVDSGFKQLDCRVFKSGTDPNLWMEIFVYDMNTPKNALAVFGVQRRAEGENIGVADFAYKTPDAIFMAKGRYYVEISGSAASGPLAAAMEGLAAAFVTSVGSQAGQIEELSLFPKEDLAPQSFKLYISDAYGFDGFKNLYAASYNVDGGNITGFIIKLPDVAGAEKLAKDYSRFLADNGATSKTAANEALKDAVFDMGGGEIEIVFSRGAFVGGVHGAENQDAAEKVAARILERLAK